MLMNAVMMKTCFIFYLSIKHVFKLEVTIKSDTGCSLVYLSLACCDASYKTTPQCIYRFKHTIQECTYKMNTKLVELCKKDIRLN